MDMNPKSAIIAAGQQDGGIALWSHDLNHFKHDHLLWGHEGKKNRDKVGAWEKPEIFLGYFRRLISKYT